MTYVLYNPLADNGRGRENAKALDGLFAGEEIRYLDIIGCALGEFLETVSPEDRVILSGGDGTLNCFINQCKEVPEHPIYYYPAGSGNDFMNDVKDREESSVILLNPYLKNLPVVTVNGTARRFINGVGYGIDGYCCEEGDRLRKVSTAPVNYTAIAIKGLLFRFKPRGATVTVDGKEYRYKKVWLAPTMNGRYYGGGMMIAPGQDRLGKDGLVSAVVLHDGGKLRILTAFPTIFKGEHIRYDKIVKIFTGHQVTVSFDRPAALQIDGETVPGVSTYSVCSGSFRDGGQ